MNRIVPLLLLSAFLALMPSSVSAQSAPPPKALSASDVQALDEGRGMGTAKPAELNGYPGPMHVLQLAAELELSREQRERT